jgi:predicted metal-dependent hydrolase
MEKNKKKSSDNNITEATFGWQLIRSARARSIRITIYPTGEVKVTAPRLTPEFLISKFVNSKSSWITKKLAHFSKHPVSDERKLLNSLGRKDFKEQKGKALELVRSRLEHFNKHYNFIYKNVSIRNQKSRWGSCSHRGNLSFNFKLIYLKPEIQDYVVIHELCHLKEMNHSKRFWDLVSEMAPNWKELRRGLKRI